MVASRVNVSPWHKVVSLPKLTVGIAASLQTPISKIVPLLPGSETATPIELIEGNPNEAALK